MTDGSAYHAVHLKETRARAVLWSVLTGHLARYVPAGAAALELGAGYCYWINQVAARRKVAVDAWPDLAKHAAPDVQSVVADLAGGLGMLGEERFDVALASNLIEHFEPEAAARLVAAVFARLNSTGRFIVIQPNFRYAFRSYFDDYTHRSVFTDVSLPNLLRATGFEIDLVQARFMPYSLRDGRLPVIPLLIRAYLASPLKPFAGQMLVVARKP